MALITEEQAQIKADAQNAALSAAGVVDQRYQILETFTGNFDSTWKLALIPASHNAKYNSATAAQLAAFARVYRKTIITDNTPIGAGYVAAYDANAELDPVLGPYLP